METGNDRFHPRLLSCQHTLDVALESGQIERRRKVPRVEVIDEIEHGSRDPSTADRRLQRSCKVPPYSVATRSTTLPRLPRIMTRSKARGASDNAKTESTTGRILP